MRNLPPFSGVPKSFAPPRASTTAATWSAPEPPPLVDVSAESSPPPQAATASAAPQPSASSADRVSHRRLMWSSDVGGRCASPSPVGAWVERVAEAVTEQVECQDREEQEEPWEEPEPPCRVEAGEGVADQAPPGRLVVGHTEPQERQIRLEQDVRRHEQGCVDDQGGEQVRQDLLEHDPGVARPQRAARLHELPFPQRQHVPAYEPGHVGPREEGDDEDHEPQPRLQEPVEAPLLGGG